MKTSTIVLVLHELLRNAMSTNILISLSRQKVNTRLCISDTPTRILTMQRASQTMELDDLVRLGALSDQEKVSTNF